MYVAKRHLQSMIGFHVFILFLVLQSEVSRREVELRKLGEDLVDIRRKNKMVQDKVKEQMEILQTKLDEYRLEHKAQEESLEDEIQAKEDTIISVKESIEIRMKALDLDCVDTSSVLSDEERYIHT